MSLLRAHAWGVTLTAALGSLSILSCTGLSMADVTLALMTILCAWAGKRSPRMGWLDRRISVFVLFVAIATAALALGFGQRSLPLEGMRVIWALWCTRLATARFPSHDGQALMLAVMLVCATTVLAPSPWLAPALLGFVTSLTSTLVTRQLLYDVYMRGFVGAGDAATQRTLARRDVLTLPYFASVAMLASLLLVAGAVTFACFPRSGAPSASGTHAGLGVLPDSVSLTAAPRARSAGHVLARVTGLTQQQFERGLYLRADVYDTWQAGAFHVSPPSAAREVPDEPHRVAGDSLVYQIRFLSDVFERLPVLGPIDRASVWWSGLPSALFVREQSRMEPLTAGGAPRSVVLQVQGPLWPGVDGASGVSSCPRALTTPEHQRQLLLPAAIDGRIAPLAREIVGDAPTAGGRARLLRHYLATHQIYSLTPSGSDERDPLADFLFGGKRGHCEYFATAYALMLRAVGVPARVVGGLAYGAWDRDSQTVVFRGSHAHAWVEWRDPCRGWLLDDATPPVAGEWLGPLDSWAERWRRSWDEHILSFGAEEQLAMMAAGAQAGARLLAPWRALQHSWAWPATSGLAGLCASLLTLGIGVVWLRVPRGLRFEQKLARLLQVRLEEALGRPLRISETLGQAARALGARGREALPLVAAYEQYRYGGSKQQERSAQRRAWLTRAHRLFATRPETPQKR